MHYTMDELKAALRALDESRRTVDCPVSRVDAEGNAERPGVGKTSFAYGTHGSAFLVVDPTTLNVECGACSGQVPHVAVPKSEVKIGRRTHLVTTE